MKFAFSTALRFLKTGKGQTILIMTGIAIGVSVQIFIGLLIQGLQQSLIDKSIGSSSQLTVSMQDDGKRIDNYDNLMSKIQGSSKAIISISPAADGSAFVKISGSAKPVLVRGFDFGRADKIYGINKKLVTGRVPEKEDEVLLGKNLADKLSLQKGDSLKVTTPAGKSATFTITGIFDLKNASINASWLLTPLTASQALFGYGDTVTSIESQLEPGSAFSADKIAATLQSELGSDYKVDNWKAQNADLLSGLNGQSVSSIMIQVFVLLSVLLAIASVLAISVIQKSKQIGILKAMGIKDRTASSIFLFEGLLLGMGGALLGILLGVGLILMFTHFALGPDGAPLVPVNLNITFIAFSGLIAVICAAAASLIPARSSLKLNPIEVIRNG